jgi:hypothetical protein
MQRPDEPLAPFTHPGYEQTFALLLRCCGLDNPEVQAAGLSCSWSIVGIEAGRFVWLELPGRTCLGDNPVIFAVLLRKERN